MKYIEEKSLTFCRVVHKNIHLYFSALFNNFFNSIQQFLKSHSWQINILSYRNNVELPILTAYCSNTRFWVAGVFPTFMKAGSDVIMQKSACDVKSTKYECGRNSSGWPYSIQRYVINFVSDLGQVVVFYGYSVLLLGLLR